jgi:hypothetical protein
VEAPDLTTIKDFFRFHIATSCGRIAVKPTVDSINTNAEWFFAGFTRLTGIVIYLLSSFGVQRHKPNVQRSRILPLPLTHFSVYHSESVSTSIIFMFRKDALFAYLAHVKENGNSIYVGVVDRRLQNQIDDLQVYLREFPSVTLGKGVYRIADILMVIPLLCEQSTVEEQHVSRKSATIFGQGTIPEPSTPHIGREVALVARTAAIVYI